MRKIVFIFTLLYIGVLAATAQPTIVKTEMRAVWLTVIGGIDWPRTAAKNPTSMKQQQQELCLILDQLQAANINCVLMHTRVRASVIYPSTIEPYCEYLTGKTGMSPGYDPLQFCIDECHKRGMQCHAWVVTLPVGKWNSAATKQLRQKMPNTIRKIGDEGFMNPERPETAPYLASICKEITERYDVDGIHLDYIRYPETWKITVSREEGRRNINRIVRAIHDAVKKTKPWVMFSCSPIGKFDDLTRFSSKGWNAYSKVCQDAQGWLRDGLMDALFPMMYFKGDHFYPFAIDWQQHTYGRIIAGGLGTYMLDKGQQNWSLDVLKREMYVLRDLGLGHAHFRSKFFTDNTKGVYDFSVNEFDPYPALIPPMTWEHSQAPAAPASLQVNGNVLSWSAVPASESYTLYNIYASEVTPVETEDPRNLIATRVMETSLDLSMYQPPLTGFHFAVTALDRFGNEGPARQDNGRLSAPSVADGSAVSMTPGNSPGISLSTLPTNGTTLTIPEGFSEAEYIAIETLQGTIVATFPNSRTINISQLPQGIYLVKTLNSQGITRRIGTLKK